jgi:hypothetical protein
MATVQTILADLVPAISRHTAGVSRAVVVFVPNAERYRPEFTICYK